ncbi:MAG TPA: hypothetical protein VIZ18_15715 [Ktedonobacteraceae bacterium]
MTKQANRAFFSEWTPDMAYVLGFWFADGWMSQPGRDAFIVFVCKDLDHLQRIGQVMGAAQKIYARKDGCYQLSIGSKQMWSDLYRLGGIPAKSLVARVPYVPPGFMRHFVRGFGDGDGTLYWETSPRRRPAMAMWGGVRFLEDIASVLDQETGVGVAAVRSYSGETPRIAYAGIKAKVLAKWLYAGAGLALERKALIARQFASWELSKFGWKSHAVTTPKMRRILDG